MAEVQGRGNAGYGVVMVVLGLLALAHGAQAASYLVGGTTTLWSYPPSVDINWYNDVWAKSITFKVGDELVFTYTVGIHNVWELATEADYQACSLTATQKWATGNDTIPLTAPGTFYYICGVLGHCQQGMKIKVTVAAAAAPIPAPKPAPVPAPVATPPPAAPVAGAGPAPLASPAGTPAPSTAPAPLSAAGAALAALLACLALLS